MLIFHNINNISQNKNVRWFVVIYWQNIYLLVKNDVCSRQCNIIFQIYLIHIVLTHFMPQRYRYLFINFNELKRDNIYARNILFCNEIKK